MITDNQQKQGDFLFRYRGILPVPIILGCILYYFYDYNPISNKQYIICLCISLSGLLIRILSVGFAYHKTSGKNTRKQIAESLNTSGIYSILRNPLYLANYLNWLGIILLLSNPILTIVITSIFIILYYKIILVEENFLNQKFKKEYKIYFSNTPRILPTFKNWTKPINKFNLLKSLINIKNGLLGISLIFFIINCIEKYNLGLKILNNNWIFNFMLLSVLFYISMKILYKVLIKKK
ncbi:MAG: hypothetical protein CL870_02680 [Cytophagia bacterium]|jgi:protein-S-isoprenylcysteine O-methyltransferase Ste14|nr:hypothetical protein [Cytophagia bacterium]|tara:strand:+ start:1397 stop:2107 length:711 start_codon:yes stop_codon:yes gene_type:complete